MLHLTLRKAIEEVQRVGKRYDFSITVVGGAFVRNISKGVIIQKIDSKSKTIYLSGAENPGVNREEDPTTTVDIDAIAFSSAKRNQFTRKVKDDFNKLLEELKTLCTSQKNFPAISIEPVFYHPPFPEPHPIFQFVSSVEMDEKKPERYFFRLGSITQDVAKESLQTWTYQFDSGEKIISLMPPAIQRRYAIRGFTKKPKDMKKIWGGNSTFAKFVNDFNNQTNHQYEKYFVEWDEFENSIQTSQIPLVVLKRTLWNAYWNTIGTYLAHGTGFIGKILLPLGNTFFAGK